MAGPLSMTERNRDPALTEFALPPNEDLGYFNQAVQFAPPRVSCGQ